ncbi:hypothetical protein [Algoriphagus chordae]|uniref:HPt domain-containing protein n=1 Tax=Algoriphagus chordae TaxID=237019 RepID=A0A2W7QDV9_9BACT|nr:hypothetical protein [Algoriphagus chordae]PZX46411.1 hypothetical protein LV85_04295 [Algoriphagus chordae]
METIYPELDNLISEMSDGDEAFQKKLTLAIYHGLVELKEKYAEGSSEKDKVKLHLIRHKLKPTLNIFELSHIMEELQLGKEIIETEGFESSSFASHYHRLQEKLDIGIKRVYELTE